MEVLSLHVELHKTEVAAKAAAGSSESIEGNANL